MATAAEAKARERHRVKSGVMNGLSRLILYSDKPGSGEASRWSMASLADLKGIPPGIEANYRLSKNLRKTRVEFFPKDSSHSSFKAVVFARVEEGVTQEEMERVFHHRIWQEFLALMHGTANTAENRGKAYVKLCRTFPEGLYHGYSYPNLQKGEDYTREILSGKRGEPGSVSVAESDGQEEEDGLDLGSGAGSDREEGDEDMDSQCLLPATQKFGGGESLGSMLFPKSTPKKPRRGKENRAPAAASTPQQSPAHEAGDDGGFSNESMSIIPSSMCLAATAMTSIAQQSVARAASKKKGIPEVSVPEPQPSTSAGPAPGTSADVPMDPFEGLPPAKNKTGKATKGQRIKGRAKLGGPEPNNKKARKQQETLQEAEKAREEDDELGVEELGNSDDEFEEVTEARKARKAAQTLQELQANKKRHMCGTDCRCDKMTRGALRDDLSDNSRDHKRETLRYLDFRQLMKAIGGIRGQMSQLQVSVQEVSDNQGAVKEVAEKLLLNGQADAAAAEANPGTAGTPWNNCGDCFAVFSDEEQVSQLTRLLRTVTQRATHFPREATRALFAEDLRLRVYLKRPSRHRNPGPVIILGERYWVYPSVFLEYLTKYMVANVAGVADLETAEDKLKNYFNDTRKRAKREQMAWFKEDGNKNKAIFALCYKDTMCELFEINEEAPLIPPPAATEEQMQAFTAKQAEFVDRFNPLVETAFVIKYPRGRHFVPLGDL